MGKTASIPPWRLDDSQLLTQCDCHTYRAGGPGGQKRNRTDSAVRLRHRASGIQVVGTESRSQIENRRRALRRLRLALALALRNEIGDDGTSPLPEDWKDRTGRIAISPKDARFPDAVARVLSRIDSSRGRIGEAAETLGVSTSQLLRFLRREPAAWAEAARIRSRHGLGPLK